MHSAGLMVTVSRCPACLLSCFSSHLAAFWPYFCLRAGEPPPLGGASVLVLVDSEAHAHALRPLVETMGSPASVARGASMAFVLAGGVRVPCTRLLPLLSIDAAACSERRLRVFDMRLGHDEPALQPDEPLRAGRSGGGIGGGVGGSVGGQSVAATLAARKAALWARLTAEATRDLAQMVQTTQPTVMLTADDGNSVVAQAARALSAFGGAPLIVLPTATPPWAARSLASLPIRSLARWGAAHLTISVLVSSSTAKLVALHASLVNAALMPAGNRPASRPADQPELRLLLRLDAPQQAATLAMHSLAWPQGAKHVRHRIEPVYGGRCNEGFREVIEHLEAWDPGARGAHGTGGPLSGDARGLGAAAEAEPWLLLLRDDVELSEGFYVYLRHTLAALAEGGSGGSSGRGDDNGSIKLLGVGLGSPRVALGMRVDQQHTSRADGSGSMVGHGGSSTENPLRSSALAWPSTCATVFRASAWRKLRHFARARLRFDNAQCMDVAAAEATWDRLQRDFMVESGHALRFSSVSLCRRQGDASVRLASGEEVAAALIGAR